MLFLVTACATVGTETQPVPEEYASPPAAKGTLADLAQKIRAKAEPGQSGFLLLEENEEALRWRLALIDSAQSSLDILYYLWYDDDVGQLVLKRVLDAANRGVRVRLLVDDLVLINRDKSLVAIDKVPNISLRLFNPKRQRKAGMLLDGALRFSQMNVRMHNKLIVADNHAAIIGGRNIANAYFGLNSKYNFIDIDVMGIGPVAQQSSALFDNFWNSPWSTRASTLSARVDENEVPARMDRLISKLDQSGVLTSFELSAQDWHSEWESLPGELHLGTSQMLFDRFENGRLTRGMIDPLGKLLDTAQQEIDFVNAYIIPDQDFIDGVTALTDRRVAVSILTNSLASHDVPAVNSHYKKWRRPLIEAGAKLYEQRTNPSDRNIIDTPPVRAKSIGLHSKAFSVDEQNVFIGSMNFDPRSANINSEMGVVISSHGLATEFNSVFSRGTEPTNAWKVSLTSDGGLTWTNSEETVTRQPALGFSQRFMDVFFMLFPASQF